MLWPILTIIGTVLSVYGYKRVSNYNKNCEQYRDKKDQVFSMICTVISIIACLITITQGIDGITDYPQLVKKLARVEILQTRVADIRDAHYEYKTDGVLVAGSIENWKQSTILSDYIKQLAVIEADYNGHLSECIAYKEIFILSFISSGWAISDKIYNLEYITN